VATNTSIVARYHGRIGTFVKPRVGMPRKLGSLSARGLTNDAIGSIVVALLIYQRDA